MLALLAACGARGMSGFVCLVSAQISRGAGLVIPFV
jgi:hypothetical protein